MRQGFDSLQHDRQLGFKDVAHPRAEGGKPSDDTIIGIGAIMDVELFCHVHEEEVA